MQEIQEDRPTTEPGPMAASTGFRLTVVRPEAPFTPGSILQTVSSRCSAIAWDLAVVLIVAISLFFMVGQFWRPLGIFVLAYYTRGILLLGNSPGVCLFAAAPLSSGDDDAAGSSRAVAKLAVVAAWMKAFFDPARQKQGDEIM